MSATAPAPSKNAKGAGPEQLIPPDEQFWTRYSPHHEAPLSFGGSLTVHLLGLGALALVLLYLLAQATKSTEQLPLDVVRLAGGGGSPNGVGDGPGVGKGVEDFQGREKSATPQDGLDDAPPLPALAPAVKKEIEQKFDPETARVISQSRSESTRSYAALEESLRNRLRPRDGVTAGKGKGGPGSGGGKGPGAGRGEGPGTQEGTATLNKRVRRMLRWNMRFTANTGPEYLEQLRGLGAILAFQVSEGREPQFKVVRDLRPGAQLLDEDVSKIQRIFWFDNRRNSVIDILGALRIRLEPLPSRFVAFMPESLEQSLYEMERRHVEKTLRRTFDEDKIDETEFRVVRTATGYRPELIRVTMRR